MNSKANATKYPNGFLQSNGNLEVNFKKQTVSKYQTVIWLTFSN